MVSRLEAIATSDSAQYASLECHEHSAARAGDQCRCEARSCQGGLEDGMRGVTLRYRSQPGALGASGGSDARSFTKLETEGLPIEGLPVPVEVAESHLEAIEEMERYFAMKEAMRTSPCRAAAASFCLSHL